MPPSAGEDERAAQDRKKALVSEVDAALHRGESPDLGALVARFPEEAASVESIVALRLALFEEGVLAEDDPDETDAPGADPFLTEHPTDRDSALADIKSEFLDAVNSGVRPDVGGIVHDRPELKDEVAELSQFFNFMSDALKPDFAGPAPDPVQELVLTHFRLVTMHARHPLGGLFLGVDQNTNRHVEMLVIRGQMSRARSNRLLRDVLIVRQVEDPGIVPVIETGEAHDLRFIAWEYRPDLTLDRIMRRLRRAAGHRPLKSVVMEHSDSGVATKELRPPAEELPLDLPPDAASRLLANPGHVASVLEMLASAADSLDRAHLRGLILGDVRPANVAVDRHGRARLRGFGLVQNARAAWHRLGSEATFLAPEVLADHEPPIDWRADVFGLAALTYAVLSLSEPPDFAEMPSRSERLFVDLRGAPEALVPLLDRALDKDPAARPTSCGVMADELRIMAASLRPDAVPEPPEKPAPAWAWFTLLALIIGGATAVVAWSLS